MQNENNETNANVVARIHTHSCTREWYTHAGRQTDRQATVAETWHQMSPCGVASLFFVCLSFTTLPRTPLRPPPSPSYCHRSLLFKGGEITILVQKTHNTNKPSFMPCSVASPFPSLNLLLPSLMRGALLQLLGTALQQQQLRGGISFFFLFLRVEEWSPKQRKDSQRRKWSFRLDQTLLFCPHLPCFLLPLSSSSSPPRIPFFILACLFFVYFCLVFASTRTCSLCFYYLALVGHRTEKLIMRTTWRGYTHAQTHTLTQKWRSWQNHTFLTADTHIHIHRVPDIVYMNTPHTRTHSWHLWCTLANVERRLGWITTTPNDYFMSGWEESRAQDERPETEHRVFSLPAFHSSFCVSVYLKLISQSFFFFLSKPDGITAH